MLCLHMERDYTVNLLHGYIEKRCGFVRGERNQTIVERLCGAWSAYM